MRRAAVSDSTGDSYRGDSLVMTSRFSLVFVGALLISAVYGQNFLGNLSGITTDTTGGSVPNATVTLSNRSTGLTRTPASLANGDFLFADLPVGRYTLAVSASGFQSKQVDEIEVAVSKTTNVTVTLNVAQQQSTVEVTAAAVSVDATSSALTTAVNTDTVQTLPLNGRDFRQMIKLVPGASPLQTSINGGRTTGTNYQIDG